MASGDHEVQALREAAAHRGLRLVRSRRRKPGGDYGHYGLTDPATGRPVFGIAGDDALTATAEGISAHLRSSTAATWQKSADTSAAPAPPGAPRNAHEPDTRAAGRIAATRLPRPTTPRAEPKTARERTPGKGPPRAATSEGEAEPSPAPALRIRSAAQDDAAAIAGLLDSTAAAVAGYIAAQARAGTPVLVADRGGVVGCLGWHAIPTPRCTLARIVALGVAERTRHRGIGRALVAAATQAMASHGCGEVEAMSLIAVRNAHGFFRRAGFAQTSYRFAHVIAGDEGG